MSDSLRIRGQEVQVRLTRNGRLESTLTAIKQLTFTAQFAILSEAYLGETSERKDDIFKGCSGSLQFHPESQDALSLIDFIRQRAMRRTSQANSHINLVFVATFPNGNRPRVTVPDLKFSDMPFNFSGREAYVDQTLSFEAEDFHLSLS